MSISISGTGGGGAALEQLRDKLFSRADADRNGGLSLDEFRELGKSRPDDGPAGIAGAMAADAAQQIFSALDANGDGSLGSSELTAPAGFAPPPGGGFGGSGFASDSLSALLGGQEQRGANNEVGALISELIERYRTTTDRQTTGTTA